MSYLVPFDGSFRVQDAPTKPNENTLSEKQLKKQLKLINKELYDLQRTLYAYDKYSLLLVFQAMDAAGKDSTIRTVMRGVNPAGCQVFSFKKPSSKELDHDFLWRSAVSLPERGRIGVFNRSYYEEVLVVRVHPEYLQGQKLPHYNLDQIWQQRFESIRDHEKHLARNGTVILKFWLNVSKEEQKQRFLARLTEPEKHWKFSAHDIEERKYWDQYMQAYEDMLNATSREHAKWYAIPADNKPFMRVKVAETIVNTLQSLDIRYPKVGNEKKADFESIKQNLELES